MVQFITDGHLRLPVPRTPDDPAGVAAAHARVVGLTAVALAELFLAETAALPDDPRLTTARLAAIALAAQAAAVRHE